MIEKKDINVCLRLKEELKRCDMKIGVAAVLCDVSAKTAGRWCKNIPIPADKLSILADEGVDAGYVITGNRASYIGTQEASGKYTVDQASPRAIDPEDPNAELFTLIDLYRYLNNKNRTEIMQAVRSLAADQLNEEYDQSSGLDEHQNCK